MLLPVVSVLLASALFGGLVRMRHRIEAALLCFALVMLTGFRLPVLVDVDGVSRFEWERAGLSAAAALAVWSAARLRARYIPVHETRAARNYLVGAACCVALLLLVTSAGYLSVVYRVAMLELPEFPELLGADSPANTWLTLPLTTDDRRVSAFALAIAVLLIGGVLALAAERAPARFASIALRALSLFVKILALLGLLASVVSAIRPTLVNPFHVTRHVYDWAVVVGSVSVMLALRDRSSATLWFTTALGAMIAVWTSELARQQLWWSFPFTWHEFVEGLLLRAAPLGLAAGLAASRLSPPAAKRAWLGWIGGTALTIACALLSLDGFTWFEPYLQDKRGYHTTRCLEEGPGQAYHVLRGSTSLAPGEARHALSRSRTPTSERLTKLVLHGSLDEPATNYLPVLAVAADYDLPVFVYAPYLESVHLFTVAPFYVSNSSCAIASASLRRLQQEQPPSSVRSLGELLAWLRSAS